MKPAPSNRSTRVFIFIELVQTNPAFVIRVDETELALDEHVTRCVRV